MLKKIGLLIATLLLPVVALAADKYEEGVHYEKLPFPVTTTDKKRVEVVELFGYPCPHCNSFEPLVQSWHHAQPQDVNFVRIPVVFGRSWEPLARAYYISDLLKTTDKTHQATFDAVHIEKKRFNSPEKLAEFYGKLGVNEKKFKKLYNSFAVETKLKQGESKARGYQITGVPAMVVNGKYRITAQTAGGHQEMLKVVNYLVEQERQSAN
ncbi:thiol:disulfide interchange protein DsbA/DsbL [Marinobacterium jannaschii]|uniref:thiol:disulfide interchange protein DsbA/DsbL n=1 Tax=Marinobacterium jannaschii TaxID=64970 RepID=UPI000483C994|nr:thiol:disulfide interchange protein DsbA/DsbL [Marinobacterium jannaschii]